MPTDKKRIAGYLAHDIHERFQAFAQQKGLSESKAISLILSEYLKVSQDPTHSVAHQAVTRAEFDELSQQVSQLGSLLSELESKSLNNSPVESKDIPRQSEPKSELVCVSCGSNNLSKVGRARHKKQKYKCLDCDTNFSV